MNSLFESRLVRTLHHTEMVKSFFFTKPAGMQYLPGQFITLFLENGIKRSYSLANWNENELELCISLKNEGAVTPKLWEAQPGDTFTFEGPLGGFILPPILDKDLCLICTGTGIAPFRAMLLHILTDKLPHQSVYILSGNRYLKDMLYHEELSKLAEEHPWFHYLPVCSRENHNGNMGYVHAVYSKLFSDGRDAYFMVCGWDAMCKEARNTLKSMGYNRRQYFFEQYDG